MNDAIMVENPTPESPEARQTLERPPVVGRVLHVINGEHYSGAERVQDLLAAELPRLGFDVGLACVKPGQFAQMRQARDVPLVDLPMRGRFDLRPAWRLARLVRSKGYDLLHAHTPRTAMLAALACRLSGAKLVYHVHSPTSRDSTRQWQNRLNALIERLSLRRASALIAVSSSLGRHVCQEGFPESLVTVVPNGVPGRAVRPPRETTASTWTLGTLALFRPRKGTEILIEALARLRAEGLPVQLRAIGGFETPDYERKLQDLALRLKVNEAIEWTGFRRDVDAELAQMDAFVLPSLFGEGLPMVVLEAMSAGVPVVASRVEGIPETIRDGQDGLIVEPGDPEDLAQALGRLIRGEADWESLRLSALARHAEHFSARSMAQGVAEVYRRVLAK
ncbi:MAG: glycosyltransferase [Pirellulales bacterium]|nr:glycosyltransferase [Pirellulales bacterium]